MPTPSLRAGVLLGTLVAAVGSAVVAPPASACTPLLVDQANDATYDGADAAASVATVPNVDILAADVATPQHSYAVFVIQVASLSRPSGQSSVEYRITYTFGGVQYYVDALTTDTTSGPHTFFSGGTAGRKHVIRGGLYDDRYVELWAHHDMPVPWDSTTPRPDISTVSATATARYDTTVANQTTGIGAHDATGVASSWTVYSPTCLPYHSRHGFPPQWP
jgi:hypothetical protein